MRQLPCRSSPRPRRMSAAACEAQVGCVSCRPLGVLADIQNVADGEDGLAHPLEGFSLLADAVALFPSVYKGDAHAGQCYHHGVVEGQPDLVVKRIHVDVPRDRVHVGDRLSTPAGLLNKFPRELIRPQTPARFPPGTSSAASPSPQAPLPSICRYSSPPALLYSAQC